MSKITDDVMQPCSIVVVSPFDVAQTETEHKELAKFLKSFSGKTKVILEYMGNYYESIAHYLLCFRS